jgi:L-fucose mutarotase
MLRYPLIHPGIIAALAKAGHGSRILIADANYACHTNTNPQATVIHLNLRPGLVTVEQVLESIVESSPIESATLMCPDDGSPPPVEADYQRLLGASVPMDSLARKDFYAACRGFELTVTIATGDQRHYANVLLTIGSIPPPHSDPLEKGVR